MSNNSKKSEIEGLYNAQIPKVPSQKQEKVDKKNERKQALKDLSSYEREGLKKHKRLSELKEKIEAYLEPYETELPNTTITIEDPTEFDNDKMREKSELAKTVDKAFPGLSNIRQRRKALHHYRDPHMIIRNDKKFSGKIIYPRPHYEIAVNDLNDDTFTVYKNAYQPTEKYSADKGRETRFTDEYWQRTNINTKKNQPIHKEDDVINFAKELIVEELAIARGDKHRKPTKRINTHRLYNTFKFFATLGIAGSLAVQCTLARGDEMPSKDTDIDLSPSKQTIYSTQENTDEHTPS